MTSHNDPRMQEDMLPQEQLPPQGWGQDDMEENTDEYIPLDELQDKVHPRTIFKPRTGQPNFIVCVAVNVVRILAILVLLVGLAGLGAVVGIAKGYLETAPNLDLAALDEQAQTSFI